MDQNIDVKTKIEQFLRQGLIAAGKAPDFAADDRLLTSGQLDSLFVIDFILFLEGEFKLDFSKDNITRVEIDSLNDMVALVERKLNPSLHPC